MKRSKKRLLMAGLLTLAMTVQSMGAFPVTVARAEESTVAAGSSAWLQNFEGDTEGTFEVAGSSAKASVEEGVGYESDGKATKGLLYERTGSGDPSKEDGSVVIKSASPVDVSGFRYLLFDMKDTHGTNTIKVSLIDADGNETGFNWGSQRTVKDKWVHYCCVRLGSNDNDNWKDIDLKRVTGVRIGQWNTGKYYIDNVYFSNYLFTGTPDSGIEAVASAGEVKASVESGKYAENQQVELYTEAGADVYYTTDGTDPDPKEESQKYKGVIDVKAPTTIKAVSVKDGKAGEVYTFDYEITLSRQVTATSKAGTYTDSVVVEFRTSNDKDLIYYTTDGSEPARGEGTTVQFIKPMLLKESTTFKAVAYDPNTSAKSDIVEFVYTINKSGKVAAPVFSKLEGTYGAAFDVELSADGDIYYTTDGSTPTTASQKYTAAVKIDKAMTLSAIAVADGKESEVAKAAYTISKGFSPFLKADGKVLKNNFGTGDVVTLRGINAGGWLVTEEWLCPTNAKDQLTAQKVFSERFGEETAQELIDCYQDNWWTEDDFDLVQAEGMNVLRLPISYLEMLNDDGTLKTTAFNRLQWFVENCEKRGLYVIIDMHGAVGSQNGKDHSGDITVPDVGNFFGNEENITKTIKLWEEIAKRYKDNPWVCGYDLLNEPGGAVGTPQFEVYDRLYDAVRAIDKDHVIYIESIWEPTHLPDPSFYGWQNVVYEYHFYGWDVETNAAGQMAFIQSKVKMLEDTNYDVPLLVGEFTFFSNTDSWKALDIYEEQGWSYTLWTYKVVGSGSSWGIYTAALDKVDINNDSVETIKEKWGPDKLGTKTAFTRNDKYADILKEYFAKNAPTLSGVSVDKTASVSVSQTGSGKVNVTWKKVADASGYEVYMKTDSGSYEKVKTVEGASKVSYTKSGLKEGKKYTFRVRAYKSIGGAYVYGDDKEAKAITVKAWVATPTSFKAVKKSQTKVKVSWKKVSGANGYEVYMKTGSGKYKKVKSLTKASSTSYTKSGLKKNKTYTFKVRAYKTSGKNKVYSQYTGTKKIKM